MKLGMLVGSAVGLPLVAAFAALAALFSESSWLWGHPERGWGLAIVVVIAEIGILMAIVRRLLSGRRHGGGRPAAPGA